MGLGDFINRTGSYLGSKGIPGFQKDYGIGEFFGGTNPADSGLDYSNSKPNTKILQQGGSISPMGVPASFNKPQVLGAKTSAPQPAGLSSFSNPMVNNNPGNVFNDAGNAAKEQSNAEIGSLNTQFDRLRSQAESQLPFLQSERSRSLSNLANELTGLQNQVASQKEESQANTESQIANAGQVARETQRANRNTLRALGILNSTAAGELLSKPLNEFSKIRADIIQEGTRRFNELDNFLNQKTAEHANLVAQIEDNYSRLVGEIQNDLRFNERERADAIRGANAALAQRIAEIQQAQFNWKSQVDTMKAQLAGELQQIQDYNQPQADLGVLEGLQPNLESQTQPRQVGIVEEDEEKPGLLSRIFG